MQRFFEANADFHRALLRGGRQPHAHGDSTGSCVGQIDRYRLRSLELRGNLRRLDRRAPGDPAGRCEGRRRAGSAPRLRAHPGAADPARSTKIKAHVAGRGARGEQRRLEFGVNLNNREPLIAPDYGMPQLLDLAQLVEEPGFDSVWVGDSLFSKPRYEPISLLSAISQRTQRVSSARPASSPRRATRSTSRWSGRRSTSSRAAGRSSAPARATPRRACGASSRRSGSTSIAAAPSSRRAWPSCASSGPTARSRTTGAYYDYDDITFYSGTEMGPLMPHPAAAAVLGRLQPAP